MIEAEEAIFDNDVADLVNRVVTVDTDTLDFNLRTVHDSLYPAPTGEEDPEINLTCVINTGVKVGASLTSNFAFTVGDWPAGIPITVKVLGRIQGRGGNGGEGGVSASAQDGGIALYTRFPIDLVLNEGSGEIWGGGGGGSEIDLHGGGGGAGQLPGLGGNGDIGGEDGTTEAGGSGVSGGGSTSGDGGNPGQDGGAAGNSGGMAGDAIDGVSFITKTGAGDIRGSEIN